MSVSSGSDITIPIQDSPPPPPSPYAGGTGGSKGNDSTDNSMSGLGVGGPVTIIDTSSVGVAGGKDEAIESGKKTPEPRGDVTVTVGFVNEAFQDTSPEHPKNGHPEKNGHATKMANGHKKNSNGAISITVPGEGSEKAELHQQEIHLTEAVNPELINMNILNTIPDKPNPEYGPYDNMDEYFVPVNQHKKFLRRSEKLYVTKDKRKESHWKKYVCWIAGATILAAIVTVAVLAGIGLIPQKSPNHFDSVVGTTTDSAASSADPSDIIIPESSSPSSPEINTPPSVPADSTYVPTAADIQFHITDMAYEPALNDKTSDRFHQLATQVQNEVKELLKSRTELETVYARVNEFTPGSVYVKMRVGWLDQGMVFNKVKMALSNVTKVGNNNIMPISTYEVVNMCKFNKNGCSHGCAYEFMLLDFVCNCDGNAGLVLGEDMKTCLPVHDAISSTEVPLHPEYSSYSPPTVSEEEISPAPEPTSEHAEHEHKEETKEPQPVSTEDSVDHDTQHESEATAPHSGEGVESSTEADLSVDTHEPVSHEMHHESHETLLSSPVTTTSTTEAPSVEPEPEVIEQQHHHENDQQPAFVPVETTTQTVSTSVTPEPLPILISSTAEPQQHDAQETSHGMDTTEPSILVASSHESQSHESEASSEQNKSSEHHTVPAEHSSESHLRSDLEEAVIKPTEPISPELSSSSEASVHHHIRDQSTEEEQPASVDLPVVSSEELPETTVLPQTIPVSSEDPKIVEPETSSQQEVSEYPPVAQEQDVKSTENVEAHADVAPSSEELDSTTSVSGAETDEVEIRTTVQPEQDEEEIESEQGEAHHITPFDVLSFRGPSTASPPSTHAQSEEHPPQGRSVAASVENIDGVSSDPASEKSQNLSVDDEASTEPNRGRAPRLFSTEMGNSMQSLESAEQNKSGEREELLIPMVSPPQGEQEPAGSNATESASVETSDENPDTASAVTKTSSDATREMESPASEASVSSDLSSNAADSGSHEFSMIQGSTNSESTSTSGESGVSQESPVLVSREPEEKTTVPPLSLHHDIDINYLGNNTEDKVNSEQVQPEVLIAQAPVDVEVVQNENVASHETEKISDKLMMEPEVESEATTVAPIAQEKVDDENVEAHVQAVAEVVQEEVPAQESEDDMSQSSSGDTVRDETSAESGSQVAPDESSEDIPATTSRGLVPSVFATEEALESPNRDHRDTEADIETLVASESEDDAITTTTTTQVPLTSSTTTTTTTTPVPQVASFTTLPTTNSTTTTIPPNKSADLSSISGFESSSQESSRIQSQEGDLSPEKSFEGEPSFSASSEHPSLESRSSSASEDDLHHNELT